MEAFTDILNIFLCWSEIFSKFESSYNIPEPDSDMCDFELVINVTSNGRVGVDEIFEYDVKVKYVPLGQLKK